MSLRIQGYFFLSWRRTKHRLLESLLIVIAIAFAVGIFSTVLGLWLGINDLEASLTADQLTILAGSPGESFTIDGVFTHLMPVEDIDKKKINLTMEDLRVIYEALNDEALVYTYKSCYHKAFGSSVAYDVIEATPDFLKAAGLEIDKGYLFTHEDVFEGNKKIVLGADSASMLFPREEPLGKSVNLEIKQGLEVIGTLKAPTYPNRMTNVFLTGRELSRKLFIPHRLVPTASAGISPEELDEYLFGQIHKPSRLEEAVVDKIIVRPLAGGSEKMEFYKRWLEELLLPVHGKGFYIEESHVSKESFQWFRQVVLTIGGVSIIALLVAALNVMNLMMARVFRRTDSIGLSIALGAKKQTVFKEFLGEALFLGLTGGLLGLILIKLLGNFVGSFLTAEIPLLYLLLDSRVVLAGLGISLAITFLFGIYPALQAAKISAADTMRFN